jgi:hypothetical protein
MIGPRGLQFPRDRTAPSCRVTKTAILSVARVGLVCVAGCQNMRSADHRMVSGSVSAGLAGVVHGGQQPMSGAIIQLYSMRQAVRRRRIRSDTVAHCAGDDEWFRLV